MRNRRIYFTGVAQCSRLLDADFPMDQSRDYDAVNLLELADLAAAHEIWEEPDTKAVMLPDELLTFSRPVIECWMVTEERVMRAGPLTQFPVLRFLKRAPGIGADEFLTHWQHEHAALELADGGLIKRYVHDRVLRRPPSGFNFDLICELWFGERADAERYFGLASQGAVRADREGWCDVAGSIAFTAKVTHSRPALAVAPEHKHD